MTKRKTYHVTKTDDGWQGKLAGGKRGSVKGETKAEVVKKQLTWLKTKIIHLLKLIKQMAKFRNKGLIPRVQTLFLLKVKVLVCTS